MLYKIDWLSFTVKADPQADETEVMSLQRMTTALDETFEDWRTALDYSLRWRWGKGRTPYKASFIRPDNGVTIFVHPRLNHSLIEVSGRACDTLADYPHSGDFLAAIAPRLTRIDIAADMYTATDPIVFTDKRDEGRFRSHSEFVSESGTTSYIGSRQSNRYARVYRYNPPHDRAHLLRCEFVMKHEDAEYTARAVLEQGLAPVVVALGQQFGWQHSDWQPDEQEAALLKVWRPERKEGKTLFWLADTVAPLLVRLHQEGAISAQEWFNEHVVSKLNLADLSDF